VVDLDVLADTVLREAAHAAIDAFAAEHGCPVKRVQIEGLRQIARNEPGAVKTFAENQRKKAEKRRELASGAKKDRYDGEIAFWDLVVRLCVGASSAPAAWSLARLAEELARPDQRIGKKPHGGAPAAEHLAYQEAKKRAGAWQTERMAEDVPIFFQRFCAQYLYTMSLQAPDDRRDDR
jgi:hypothetical protein